MFTPALGDDSVISVTSGADPAATLADTDAPPKDGNAKDKMEQGEDKARQDKKRAVSDRQEFIRLSKLSPADYDRQRPASAKRLSLRVSVLDKEVDRCRKAMLATSHDKLPRLKDPDPWSDPVDGAALLSDIKDQVLHYVSLSDHAATAIALWVLHTWTLDAFDVSPFLFLRSPQKRCGRTTLMQVLAALVRRAFLVTGASPAALYRVIEAHQPTLLLDGEYSRMAAKNELRGILNGGHMRATAYVLRMAGKDHEPYPFPTFCPKVLSGIGRQADGLEDRSIIIPMRRKLSGEKLERLRLDQLDLGPIRQQCLRWAADHGDDLKRADPLLPQVLNDSFADNWRPLFAIASAARGEWPAAAHEAALAVSAAWGPDDADAIQLLQDIRGVFTGGITALGGTAATPLDRISSADLVQRLVGMPGRPWAAMSVNRGQPLTQHILAKSLSGFDVAPRNIAIGKARPKGYLATQFEEAFTCYLTSTSEDEGP